MRKFMRTRAPPSPSRSPSPSPSRTPCTPTPLAAHTAHNGNGKLNGHAKGAAGAAGLRGDLHSTISSGGRWWGATGGTGVQAQWEDPEFPAEWRRVGDRRVSAADVVWMRPHELSAHTHYAGDGGGGGGGDVTDASYRDDDRWRPWRAGAGGSVALATAADALATCPRLLRRVLPPSTSTSTSTSTSPDTPATPAGALTFRLWEWGAWRSVTVDDRLPARRSLLVTSPPPADLTLPLLEKAYAKLYGSYGALRDEGGGGDGGVSRALQDLTGCIVQSFPLAGAGAGAGAGEGTSFTFHVLNSAVPRCTLIVTYAESSPAEAWRALPCGLVAGRAYTVTGLARVRGDPVPLVRVRGATGAGGWRGRWARGEARWRTLSPRDRDVLGAGDDDAEFWMSFSEFTCMFSRVCLVHCPPDARTLEPLLRPRRPWRCVLARRRWTPGFNAGGAPCCTETARSNPQFRVSVPRCADDDLCHVVVALCQQYRAAGEGGATTLQEVGVAVYAVGAAGAGGSQRALDVAHGGRSREVVSFFTLGAGEYVLVPHTRRADVAGGFLLRVLTDRHTAVWEVNEDNVVLRDAPAEILHPPAHPAPPAPPPLQTKSHLTKLCGNQDVEEVDVERTVRALRGRAGRRLLGGRAERGLARSLLELCASSPPPCLLRLLGYWRSACAGYVRGCGATRGVRWWEVRAALRAAGVCCSNKVLEVVATRYCRPPRRRRPRTPRLLTVHDLALVLARIHLAHYRYRSLEARLKSNPLSLEEMILMTICS